MAILVNVVDRLVKSLVGPGKAVGICGLVGNVVARPANSRVPLTYEVNIFDITASGGAQIYTYESVQGKYMGTVSMMASGGRAIELPIALTIDSAGTIRNAVVSRSLTAVEGGYVWEAGTEVCTIEGALVRDPEKQGHAAGYLNFSGAPDCVAANTLMPRAVMVNGSNQDLRYIGGYAVEGPGDIGSVAVIANVKKVAPL